MIPADPAVPSPRRTRIGTCDWLAVAVWQREQITQIGLAGVTAALRSRCDQLSVELLTSVRRRLRRPPGRPGILDAVFVPYDVVHQAAVAVADHEGLAEDWVKDAVKGFLLAPTRTRSASTQAIR